MTSPTNPPPLPGRKKSSVWLFLILGVAAILMIALIAGAVHTFQRVQAKAAATKTARADLEKSATESRNKMADAIEQGKTEGSGEVIGELKAQLDKSAGQLSGEEAGVTRAMSAYLTKMQTQAGGYEAALKRLLEAEVLQFALPDRATLEVHRGLLRAFSAANEELTDTVRRAEEMALAELQAEKISSGRIKATMTGFNQGRPHRQLQLTIREQDRILGTAGLEALDLLEKSWGRWSRDETSGQLTFQDDAAREVFNGLITRIQSAADEQTKAQQELAAKMRTMKGR